jgi:F-type H+-transporting ATPase subunit a
VTTPKKRGCLGCSFPVLIVAIVVALSLLTIGFLSGGIGQKLFPGINLPAWLKAAVPAPELPSSALFHILGWPVTNTMIAGWITIIFLVLGSWLITRRFQLVPGRLQSVFEAIIGWIYDFSASVAGKENGRTLFPVVCTIFLYILFNAWLSLIPGFGSIMVHLKGGGETELLRGANTDVNTPIAIALISFIFVAYYGLKTIKFKWIGQYLNFGPLFHAIGQIFKGKLNVMDIFSGAIGVFVGMLELLSMFIRIISFTFRLFGNMTAGEILIMVATFLIPLSITWAVYGLEMFFGFIQALVFSGLTLAFASMAMTSHEESH